MVSWLSSNCLDYWHNNKAIFCFSLIQFSSVAQLCPTLCDPMYCSTPGFPVHHQLPELAQTHVYHISNAIQPSHPLSSPSPPAFNLSQNRVFPKESVCHIMWQNTGVSASPSVLPMNIQDWFPLGLTFLISLQCKVLSSLLQHHSSKASILRHSAFLVVQLSHPYMTTGKTIALTRWTFVGKVTKLCNMLSRLVIAFLPGNKSLLISWLQSHSAVILEPPKIKSVTVSCFPIYLPWSDGTGCHDLSFLNVEL